MRGEAPYHIEFRWVYGPPLPAGLEPEARRALITQRAREFLENADAFEGELLDADGTQSQVGRRPRRADDAHCVARDGMPG
jgi:hypothetical protein